MINKIAFAFIFLPVLFSCKNNEQTVNPQLIANKVKILTSPADTASAEPYLFTDKNGLVYLSWIERKGKESFLKFSTLDDSLWSAPIVIASGLNWFVNWADYPLLAADGNNNLMAHYLEKSGKGTYAYDVKFTNSADGGKSWSTPTILHDDGKQAEHGFVSMISAGENYFVSWLDGRNAVMEESSGHDSHGEEHAGAMSIRAATINKQGNKTEEWELDNRVCDCCQTAAVWTTNGPVVFYRDRAENEIRDISVVRLLNGQWTSPKTIFADNWEIDGCPVNGPRAAAKGNNLAVTWFSSPGKNSKVNLVFSKNGGETFSAPIRIDDGDGIGRVDVEMPNENFAIVSWVEKGQIRTRKVYTDGKLEPSVLIATSSEERSGGFPQMTLSENKLIFAWTDDKEGVIKTASVSM